MFSEAFTRWVFQKKMGLFKAPAFKKRQRINPGKIAGTRDQNTGIDRCRCAARWASTETVSSASAKQSCRSRSGWVA